MRYCQSGRKLLLLFLGRLLLESLLYHHFQLLLTGGKLLLIFFVGPLQRVMTRLLVDVVAAEFEILKLLCVPRLDELVKVGEIESCVDAALTDALWQVGEQPVNLLMSETGLLGIIVKRELKVPQLLEHVHASLHKFCINQRYSIVVIRLLSILIVNYDQLFKACHAQ